VYYDRDADVSNISDKTVAVLGYGSQGHAHALNLRQSGIDVIVGLHKGSSSRNKAEEADFRVETPSVAAANADYVSMLVPDTVQPSVYAAITDELDSGDTLQFAHGFNIHYGQIEPPENVNVTMIAPKSPGHLVRRNYETGTGTPGLLAVYQNITDDAKAQALGYAKAIGCTQAGVVETTFREETETDIFGEQAVLCGGITELIKAGFDTLVDEGYSPEMAYFECLHEMKLITDLMYEGGTVKMWDSVSDTAEYGGLTRGNEVINDQTRNQMQKILQDIQDGSFTREWVSENQANRPSYKQLRKAEQNHQIEQVGKNLRQMFTWADSESTEGESDLQ
jgi:ketol-acid reductoisomerase